MLVHLDPACWSEVQAGLETFCAVPALFSHTPDLKEIHHQIKEPWPVC